MKIIGIVTSHLWLIALVAVSAMLLIKPTRNFLLRIASSIRGFLNEVVEELKKVSWPSKTELRSSTVLVVVAMLILIVFIGVIDVALNTVIGLIIGRRL